MTTRTLPASSSVSLPRYFAFGERVAASAVGAGERERERRGKGGDCLGRSELQGGKGREGKSAQGAFAVRLESVRGASADKSLVRSRALVLSTPAERGRSRALERLRKRPGLIHGALATLLGHQWFIDGYLLSLGCSVWVLPHGREKSSPLSVWFGSV